MNLLDATDGGALSCPLVLDLDHTLVRGDLFHATLRQAVRTHPLLLLRTLLSVPWIGRAAAKRVLAEAAPPDVEAMPLNQDVLRLAQDAHRDGREVWIATAAEHSLAIRVAARVAFVSGLMASDGSNNLKGKAKATALVAKFPSGFDYVGDSFADLEVWRHATVIYVVEPSPRLVGAIKRLNRPFQILGSPGQT